jgi:hypothetical protein
MSKRTLHCGHCFHCIGSGFLGGIDSGFWLAGRLLLQLAIVLTVGFRLPLCFLLLEFSIVFKKVIDVFGCGV